MLTIGMIGPAFLLHYNREILAQQQAESIAIRNPTELSQIDGLLITGWRCEDYTYKLRPLYSMIQKNMERLSLFGIAAGAVALDQNNLGVINCNIFCQPARTFTTSILEIPSFRQSRFVATFLPELRFSALAPSLGILCEKSRYGSVVVRQGNHLACSYLAELTPHHDIYHYWLQMVSDLKNTGEF